MFGKLTVTVKFKRGQISWIQLLKLTHESPVAQHDRWLSRPGILNINKMYYLNICSLTVSVVYSDIRERLSDGILPRYFTRNTCVLTLLEGPKHCPRIDFWVIAEWLTPCLFFKWYEYCHKKWKQLILKSDFIKELSLFLNRQEPIPFLSAFYLSRLLFPLGVGLCVPPWLYPCTVEQIKEVNRGLVDRSGNSPDHNVYIDLAMTLNLVRTTTRVLYQWTVIMVLQQKIR